MDHEIEVTQKCAAGPDAKEGEATSLHLPSLPGGPANQTGSSSPGKPRIGLQQEGRQANFSDETVELLRNRLRAAAIVLTVVLGTGLVGNAIAGNHSWLVLRTVIFAGVVGSFLILRGGRAIRLRSLRAIELLLFGGVAVQVGLMMYSTVGHHAARNDAVSMTGAQQFYYSAFCLHVLTFATFVPNTWRRAAVVTVLIAITPYLIWFGQIRFDPHVARLSGLNLASSPIPVTLIAALIGTFGSHIIQRSRREAFQARQFLQYRLQEKIGSGGMGDVFRAEHVLLKRQCAIKLIRAEQGRDARTLKLFEREVVATARLTHWNTIDIYDYGHTDDGTFYYVMELLQGASLQTLVTEHGPLPAARVVYLLAQACDALQEAHEAGLIHRDIKPANIFVTHRGGLWDVAKLLDFGLVKVTSADDANSAASSGFSGTPAYMAPEQARHYDQADGRSDLYALGGVACFLLTGQPPFGGSTITELLAAHAFKPPPGLSDRIAGIPADLEKIVLRLLEKNPASRFQSARELSDALRAAESAAGWSADRAKAWWAAVSRTSADGPELRPHPAATLVDDSFLTDVTQVYRPG